MNQIPSEYLEDPNVDGSCKEARTRICHHHNFIVESIAHVLYSDEQQPFGYNYEESVQALKHVRECAECMEWFEEFIPEEISERNIRMEKYCCSAMFCAVEESTEQDMPKFELGYFKDDILWRIDGKLCCPKYCPWCGKKLPMEPFRKTN